MCLKYGFVIFWRKDFGAKAAHKMLVKLTPGGRNWQLIYPTQEQMSLEDEPIEHMLWRKFCTFALE
jgi:hypothetical protein